MKPLTTPKRCIFRHSMWPTGVSIHDKTLKVDKIHCYNDVYKIANPPISSGDKCISQLVQVLIFIFIWNSFILWCVQASLSTSGESREVKVTSLIWEVTLLPLFDYTNFLPKKDDAKCWNLSWNQNDWYTCLWIHVHSFDIPLLFSYFSWADTFPFLSPVQGPTRKYLGAQRQRGRTSDNPNVQEFLKNTGALRVVNSFSGGPTTGNCRIRESLGIENTPLSWHSKK